MTWLPSQGFADRHASREPTTPGTEGRANPVRGTNELNPDGHGQRELGAPRDRQQTEAAGEGRRDKTERVDHFRRMGALRRKLTRAGLPGLLVTHLPDIRYLCGFTGSSAALAVTRRGGRMFTDGRYTAQAAEEVSAAQVQIASGSPAVAATQWLAAQAGWLRKRAWRWRDSIRRARPLRN